MTDKKQENKRLFFGLDLPKNNKQAITNWLASQVISPRKPVLSDNLHLTLAFLPNVNSNTEKQLIDFANTFSIAPFSLRFEHCDYWQHSGIFYLRPTNTAQPLIDLATQLRDFGEQQGIYHNPFSYHPHITLIRGCKQPPQVLSNLAPFDVSFEQFKLFHSTRVNNQLRYLPIQTFNLKK
jgi:2'-5' RNA ligase